MSKNYYNVKQFLDAINLINTKLDIAIIKLEKYIEDYPLDYSGYSAYASALIKKGRFHEAEKMINYVDKCFDEGIIKHSVVEKQNNLILNKLKLYLYTERYQEFNRLYKEKYRMLQEYNIELTIPFYYNSKQLGSLNLEKKEDNGYIVNQIIEYSEKDFQEHIKKHLSDYWDKVTETSSNIFEPDFPLKKILDYVKNNVPNDNKIHNGFFDNVYIYKFDENGRVDHKLVNYFKIVTFHNTNNLITMFPIDFGEYMTYTDLNFLKEKKEEPKIKRISQIDKFNKKYNLK